MKGMRTHLHQRLMLAIGLGFLLMLLVACGTSATGSSTATGGATSTPTPPTRTQKCGTVHTIRLHVVPTDQTLAQNNENCFWQAYQQCHPAMLVYSQGSVDTVTLHTFSLKSQNGQCIITDAVQHSVLPRSPSPLGNYTCSNLAQQNDGLHFTGCGKEGAVLVPSVGTE